MNKDIRLQATFFHHPKAARLQRRLGDAGLVSLLRLWCYAGVHRPKGIFRGMDILDIALAAGWTGDEREFIAALEAAGFLEIDEGSGHYRLHDWEEHNPYAFYAEERSEQARKAAEARWASRRGKSAPSKGAPTQERPPEPKEGSDDLLERWNGLAKAYGASAVRKITPQRLEKYRKRRREFPDFWGCIQRELPLMKRELREAGWFGFPWLVHSSDNFAKFSEGNYRGHSSLDKGRPLGSTIPEVN